MHIEQLKKHGMIAAAVSAAVLLAACDQGGADRAAAPTEPPAQAAGTPPGSTPGAVPGTTRPPTAAQADKGPSVGDRAQAAGSGAMSAAGDAAITAKVKSALVAEDDVRSLAIDVDTNDGRVVLEGEVSSAEQSMRIEQLAQAVEGVLSVENRLKVMGS